MEWRAEFFSDTTSDSSSKRYKTCMYYINKRRFSWNTCEYLIKNISSKKFLSFSLFFFLLSFLSLLFYFFLFIFCFISLNVIFITVILYSFSHITIQNYYYTFRLIATTIENAKDISLLIF